MSELKEIKLDAVHDELLDAISDTYQKTEGFPTWDLLRAGAFGLKQLWDKALKIEWMQDVDNLTGEDLDKLVNQRTGLIHNAAVKAVGVVTVKGTGYIIKGDLFETEDGIQFQATEDVNVVDEADIPVEAVEGGLKTNVAVGTITQMPVTISGIFECTNNAQTTGGYDEETDDEYRQRYYDYLRIPATCGNKYHYSKWAKEVDGVGNARCIPCWNGINTVKVIIVGNDNKPAASSLVTAVQEYIDPQNGEGLGEAPIGAVCTVVSATPVNINVSVDVDLSEGIVIDDVKDDIKKAIDEYIKSTVFTRTKVSYAQIGSAILDVPGVEDYDDLLVNGEQESITIAFSECPVLNEVTIS